MSNDRFDQHTEYHDRLAGSGTALGGKEVAGLWVFKERRAGKGTPRPSRTAPVPRWSTGVACEHAGCGSRDATPVYDWNRAHHDHEFGAGAWSRFCSAHRRTGAPRRWTGEGARPSTRQV